MNKARHGCIPRYQFVSAQNLLKMQLSLIALALILVGRVADTRAEECTAPASKWFPLDDLNADLTPIRALDASISRCRSISPPRILAQEVSLIEFYENPNKSPQDYFVAVNGAAIGGVFELEDPSCLGALARLAYENLVPPDWERGGPLFLYSSGGLPIRNPEDVEIRARRELYVLNSRQAWVWPAHEIKMRFTIESTTLVTVSDHPRVFSLEGFLTTETCDEIINEYDKKLEPSPEKHYSDGFKNHRTSETGWMSDHPLRRKIQRILRLPSLEYVEYPQFLKYVVGKWYKYHHDYFHNYSPSAWQETRRWIRMRISSLVELPEDWSAANDDEKPSEDLVLAASKVFKSVVENPRGTMKLTGGVTSSNAPVLYYVMTVNAKSPPKTLSRIMPELYKAMLVPKEQQHDFHTKTFDKLAETDPDTASKVASHLIAETVAKELSKILNGQIDQGEFASVLQYPDRLHLITDLETEPIRSQIQPNRHATILPYLSDIEAGGETALPDAIHPEAFLGENFVYPKYKGAPECSKGLLLSPKKGSASMFYHRLPSGGLDERSLHAGCPPKKGTKYAINGFTWSAPIEYGISHFQD